jgi:hypothetical protein
MPLTTGQIATGKGAKASDVRQFYDLFTGAMDDQPVTFKNTLTVGSNQPASGHALVLKGVNDQTGDYLRVVPFGEVDPVFSIDSSGKMAYSLEMLLGEITSPNAPASGCALYSKAGGGLFTRPVGGAEAEVATLTKAQALTNKTLVLPKIHDTTTDHQYLVGVSELAASRTVTLPALAGNDEFVFKDHPVTLTQKTLTSPIISDLSNMQHDHSVAGKGGQIGLTALPDGVFTADAAGRAKFGAGLITAAQLATNAVETAKIKDAAVETAKIKDAAVETAKIKDGNVTGPKMALQNTIWNHVTIDADDSPYTVPDWGYHVDVDASGGPVTVVLPTAVDKAGALIEVRKVDASINVVTVVPSGAETINGEDELVIYGQYDSYSLRSDGSGVVIV